MLGNVANGRLELARKVKTFMLVRKLPKCAQRNVPSEKFNLNQFNVFEYFLNDFAIKPFHDFMERGCVAPKRKAKIPIPAAICRVFRNFSHNPVGLWHRTFAKK
jgi:hypothetical protein